MGSAERIRNVSGPLIAEQARKRPVAVVVSAMSKVTDLLLDSMRGLRRAMSRACEASRQTRERRHTTCRELLPPTGRRPCSPK